MQSPARANVRSVGAWLSVHSPNTRFAALAFCPLPSFTIFLRCSITCSSLPTCSRSRTLSSSRRFGLGREGEGCRNRACCSEMLGTATVMAERGLQLFLMGARRAAPCYRSTRDGVMRHNQFCFAAFVVVCTGLAERAVPLLEECHREFHQAHKGGLRGLPSAGCPASFVCRLSTGDPTCAS